MKLDVFSHVESLCSIKGQDLCWWHLTPKKKTPKKPNQKSLLLETVLTHWMIITTFKLLQTVNSEVLIESACA